MPAHKRAGGTMFFIKTSEFGWDAARVAALDHSTLPWFQSRESELSFHAQPLRELATAGNREKLSLLGQFAAHCALLRFAGVTPAEFDPAEWIVVRKRGSDSRLVRTHARPANGQGDIPLVSSVEAFAAAVGVDFLAVLRQSWAKAEAVFAEIERTLRGDAAADLRWFRASAAGWLQSPGEEALRSLLAGPRILTLSDPTAADTVGRFAQWREDAPPLFVFGGEAASPLQRYSAVPSLRGHQFEIETAEAIADRVPRAIAVVGQVDSFDESSKRLVLGLMRVAQGWSWLVPAQASDWLPAGAEIEEAGGSRPFILSSRLAAAEQLSRELLEVPVAERRDWLAGFVAGKDFSAFLDNGTLPASRHGIAAIQEPRRSYLAALSILGSRVDFEVARELLSAIGCCLDLEDLVVEGITSVEGDEILFSSEPVRRRLSATIQPRSRASLSALAAEILERIGDSYQAAVLYQQGGRSERARELLQSIHWSARSGPERLRLSSDFPPSFLRESPLLASICAQTLIENGQYLDARDYCAAASDGRLLAAQIERRLGNYGKALGHLEGLSSGEAAVARGELHRLRGEYDKAQNALDAAGRSGAMKARWEYEVALLAYDRGEEAPALPNIERNPYLAARWRSYQAMRRREYVSAAVEAERACSLSATMPEAIDAALDLLYAHFLAGDWESARHQARRALSLVEETQGDRAAGGILFTLAYLCADSAHWSESQHAIERLSVFYRAAGDERRLDELRMLRAHLAFSRGHFAEARQILAGGADPRWSDDIREAAHLILDEIDWMEGRLSIVRTAGASACLELSRRHHLNLSRTLGKADAGSLDSYSLALFQFEAALGSDRAAQLPQTSSRSAKLRLFRSLVGLLRRRPDEELESRAHQIAGELQIEFREVNPEEGLFACELQLLQLLALAQFPFSSSDLGDFRWQFVSRNRLGRWSQLGPLPPLRDEELSRLDRALPPDWIACGDCSFLHIEGFDQFSPKSREAMRALFTLQAESFRLRRVSEQEALSVADQTAISAEGILGESPAIREIVGILDKVARRDVSICILGESGTGKELFARAIHSKSSRRNKTFTAINCAALPENLVESELFGHARGAFTGADRDRAGLLEVSDGGTLFLDEIGELPLSAQAKLLRFLQEGEYRRVGETAVRRADVRVIAATNRKLDEAVDAGTFREDLYYRVRGIELQIPPLRDRGSDILLLAGHFLAQERQKHRSGPVQLSDEVEAVFLSYSWPGNVRELQNTIRAAHALAGERSMIQTEYLPQRLQSVLIIRTPKGTFHDELSRFRRGLIEKSLLESGGNQNRAAKSLGMTRQALAYQIRELGILVKK